MFAYTTLEESVRRAPAAAGLGEGVPRQARARLPRHRRGRRRPRAVARSASSTARPGSRPRAATASSPRPRTAPTSRPAASTSAAGSPRAAVEPVATLNGTLCAITAHDRRDPRDPPAGRRLGAGARRRCSPTCRAARCSKPVDAGDRPVTLAAPAGRARHRRHAARKCRSTGHGRATSRSAPAVHDAVHRAYDAGRAHRAGQRPLDRTA